ncbi:hypothetical protein [Clostridium psychrophilum]|uniref:hypothetical protein n=1 Tax=Clostridium psychrophilum TaxID=132926 RepID=UPI001C0BAA42|nr:hypothetical protein [Clostridium psychrophilum]MBU3181427.1 hypothetical protein [Clostridium psychrophilum]
MLVAIQNESIMFTIDGNNIEIKKEVSKSINLTIKLIHTWGLIQKCQIFGCV